MEEYIVLSEDTTSIQKKLNQWRHDYYLNIIGMSTIKDKDSWNITLTVILTRTRKES